MLVQTFLSGIVYYSQLYYLPIYYENVRGWPLMTSAALTVPIVIAQSIASIFSGQYISRMKRYGEVIWSGYALWTLGVGLTCIFDRKTSPAVIAVILSLAGVGIGKVWQPLITALQAHCPKSQRAVVISNRNFLRNLGGACGLAFCPLILQSSLKSNLPPQYQQFAGSAYSRPNMDTFTEKDRNIILDAYMKANRTIFIFLAPIMGVCLLMCVLVKDRGLEHPVEPAVVDDSETESVRDEKKIEEVEEGVSSVGTTSAVESMASRERLDTVETR